MSEDKFKELEEVISRHFSIESVQLKYNGKDKSRIVTDARRFLWYIMVKVLGYSGIDVARMFGVTKRNVFYSVALIGDGVKVQPYYSKHYSDILKELKERDFILKNVEDIEMDKQQI